MWFGINGLLYYPAVEKKITSHWIKSIKSAVSVLQTGTQLVEK